MGGTLDDGAEAAVNAPFLMGSRLYLRPLESADLTAEYIRWLNDAEVTRYLVDAGRFPSTQTDLEQFLKTFQASRTSLIFAIVDRTSHQHIGNVTLNHISWIHRRADTGMMIGRKDFWGRGYAREAWYLLADYAFRRLGLHKLVAGAYAENRASIAVLEKLGFRREGNFRSEYLLDGEFHDGVRLGLLKEEFFRIPPPDPAGSP